MINLLKSHDCKHSKLIRVEVDYMNRVDMNRYDTSNCEICGALYKRIREVKKLSTNIFLDKNLENQRVAS